MLSTGRKIFGLLLPERNNLFFDIKLPFAPWKSVINGVKYNSRKGTAVPGKINQLLQKMVTLATIGSSLKK